MSFSANSEHAVNTFDPHLKTVVAIRREDQEQITNKLREAEVLFNQGATITVISKKIGVSDHTCYCWRKEYGGMMIAQAKRQKVFEVENSR